MGKDKNANEIESTLARYGWVTRSEKPKNLSRFSSNKSFYVSGEETGEPDIIAVLNGRGVFIEAKTFRQAFNFSQYKEEQHQWAEDAVERGEHVWCWFFGGDDPANYNRDKKNKNGDYYRPRSAWLFPYQELKKSVAVFDGLQKSIPYGELKRMNPTIRKENLTFTGIFDQYELLYDKGPTWHLYEEHPFAQKFMDKHEDLRYRHNMRFATGDVVGIQGYMSEYEIVDRDYYDIENECWLYVVEDVVSGMAIDRVLEKIMYLKEY